MKKFLLLGVMLYVANVYSQYTLIPDEGFESFLVVQGIDSDGEVNGQVLTSDIENITSLHLHDPFHTISDMTGVEDFTALEDLEIWLQDFTTIDVANLVNLKDLYLSNIPIEHIDISNNVNLIELHLHELNISDLDLNNNLNLEILYVGGTQLTEIDVSNHSLLKEFTAVGTSLQYINLQNGNNGSVLWHIKINYTNESLICVQVDDPQAVIDGDPPYQYWEIDESIGATITDNCGVFSITDNSINNIALYPNPVKNMVQISSNNLQITGIEVYNTLGEKVLSKKGAINLLDVSNLTTGLYLLKIKTEKGELVKKIMKE